MSNTLSENGSVSRGVCSVDEQGFLTDVVERTKIERRDNGIYFTDETGSQTLLADNTPVSMNLWGVHHSALDEFESQFREFVQRNTDKPRAEFYIPTVINNLLEAGKIRLKVMHSDSQWYGVTYPEDKETVQKALSAMNYPKGLWK